ncbi:hypothetical protein Taro_037630 [Colocasia esculenta]|uniref:CCHC-type domain-containing protein n=1 Tax=Colocasia esculenta TaxID=4460 RepID=A0A843WJU6_COLES|nr:hypothetical protein [Colocasia esculenta]
MEYFLQGHDYQIWSIVEGDLVVTNEKAQWIDDDRKKISLNCKAKSILCCALSKKEFNRVSACKSSMEMWKKLRITYEGTDKVKETRIDILVTQYERFQMQSGESITQMFSQFTDITNGLAGLGKTYEIGDMVRKILRSLPASWTLKVTAIEEANDLKRMSVEKFIGSLMAHEINMERLGESSSRKKHSNALRAEEDSPEASSAESESDANSENEEAMLSRILQRILAKKKKFQSGRRHFKRNKDFKKPDGKEMKKGEPICYECKRLGHIKVECPKFKKPKFRKKDSSKKFRKYKKKAMAAAWENSSDSDSESSSCSDEEEANLAFMANTEEKSTSSPASSTTIPSPSPILEIPPATSAGASSSSSSGPSLGPVDDLPTTSHSFLHPTPPPSFITIILERAQLNSPFMEKIKDEFEEEILRSVLKVGEHVHREDSSSPAPKKRKITSTSSISSEPKYPPLWFSLTVDNKQNPLYREYLSKVVLATIINLPFQNLSDHLNTILPYTSLSKSEKSKIFSLAHSKTEEQWGKGHKDLLKKFILAKSARFPPRDHSLTLSEWFRMYHQELWAPFIQKEINMVRHRVVQQLQICPSTS